MGQIKKVLANVQQSLTDEEKAQARANIGVGTGRESIYDCYINTFNDPIDGTDPDEIIAALDTDGVLVRLKAILGHSGSYVYLYPYGKSSTAYSRVFYGYDDGFIYQAVLNTYHGQNTWTFTSDIFLKNYYSLGVSNQSLGHGYNEVANTPSFNLKMLNPLTSGKWEMLATISGTASLSTYNLADGTWSGGTSQTGVVFYPVIGTSGGGVHPMHTGRGGALVEHAYAYDPDHTGGSALGSHTMTVQPQVVRCQFEILPGNSYDQLPCMIMSEGLYSASESATLSISNCTFRKLIDNVQT
jgi:hypothetical protein